MTKNKNKKETKKQEKDRLLALFFANRREINAYNAYNRKIIKRLEELSS